MPSSKEEARLEAYKKLRDEALISERTARARAESSDAKARSAEEKALKAAMDLDVTRDRLRDAEAKVERLSGEVEGAKADLLATTRRMIVTEMALEQSSSRVESLRSILEQIATWPHSHSSEATAMRATAVKGLSTDRLRQRATKPELRT